MEAKGDVKAALCQVVEHTLRLFNYSHLPPPLQEVSKPFYDLAHAVARRAPENFETSISLRRLLEAKDAAVRAAL